MAYGRPPRRVEDYTTANLVLIFVNLLWIFGVIWATYGLLAVIVVGYGLNHGITWLSRRKQARETASRWSRRGLGTEPDDLNRG